MREGKRGLPCGAVRWMISIYFPRLSEMQGEEQGGEVEVKEEKGR